MGVGIPPSQAVGHISDAGEGVYHFKLVKLGFIAKHAV